MFMFACLCSQTVKDKKNENIGTNLYLRTRVCLHLRLQMRLSVWGIICFWRSHVHQKEDGAR